MFILDLLFPKFCLGCGYIGVYLCPSCLKRLEPVEQDVCLYCRKPSLFGLTHVNCGNKLNIDGMVTIYRYNPILKIVIKNIKYRLAVQVWKDFYKMISPEVIGKLDCYKKLPSDLVIQPIPLSKNRFNERGFNQASFIGAFFQRFLHFPIVNLLLRNIEKPAQAQIKNKMRRYRNIKGIFTAKQGVNHNILLVDDIITSGSTVKEAARILKIAGAKKVYVLALAKG